MGTDQRFDVSRVVDADPHTVFELLADPRRHPELDGSGLLRAAPTAVPIRAVGDAFVMELYSERTGAYRSRSVVVRFEPDRAVGWSPGPVDEEPFGHTYTYTLEPEDPARTRVTQTYDWSAVSDPRLRDRLPLISREALVDSLDRLAVVLASG